MQHVGTRRSLYIPCKYMTTARLTKRRTSLEKHKDEVIALLLTGSTPAQIAEKYHVSKAALTKFQQRHCDRLAALHAEVERQVSDYAIAEVVNVIAGMDEDWRGLGQVQRDRAADKTYADVPGYSTGLMAHTYKSVGSGDNQQLVDEFKVDTAVIAERRNLAMAAMQLLGKMPKAGGEGHSDGNVFIFQIAPPQQQTGVVIEGTAREVPQLG
jgi:hypothetical protein